MLAKSFSKYEKVSERKNAKNWESMQIIRKVCESLQTYLKVDESMQKMQRFAKVTEITKR